MILATHAIVGAAAGRLFDNPWLSFAAGFLSHFVLDAIPHTQYSLSSRTYNEADRLSENMAIDRRFLRDLAFIGLDCVGGILLALFVFRGGPGIGTSALPLLIGMAGGVFPDFLQFVYFKVRREPFTALQKVHNKIHAGYDLNGFYGITSQAAIIVLAVILSKFIK